MPLQCSESGKTRTDGAFADLREPVNWFEPYTAEAKLNPHVQATTHGNFRSIRGSSFGYYGKPLRVTDREFNNPVYGGYIYIGFRVALPEVGMRKLMAVE